MYTLGPARAVGRPLCGCRFFSVAGLGQQTCEPSPGARDQGTNIDLPGGGGEGAQIRSERE